MTNLETILQTIETLTPQELDQVYHFIQHRRQTITWIVNKQNVEQLDVVLEDIHRETIDMTDAEIDSLIDEALNEVRGEQNDN